MSPFEPDIPEDFDDFWKAVADEARQRPLDYHRPVGNVFDLPGFEVEFIDFRGMGGQTIHGWIAYPEGARRLPGFLWIPPYGRESLLPNQYGTRQGFASMSFNFFGLDAFHQEEYVPARGYFAEGAATPETWIFKTMIQNAMIAARVFEAQIEVDEDRIGSMGMSQGAGMSIWLAAWSPTIKAVCADMPFLGAMRETFARTSFRYPLKELIDFADKIPLGMERIANTISYFDTMHHATRCNKPTHVSLGIKDPAARPANVEAVFNALPGRKVLRRYEIGHDWFPDMVENNRQWLVENLR